MEEELGKHVVKAVALSFADGEYRRLFKQAIKDFDHDEKFVETIDVLDKLANSVGYEPVYEMIYSDQKHHLTQSNVPERYLYMLTQLPDKAIDTPEIRGELVAKSESGDLPEALKKAVDMEIKDNGESIGAEIDAAVAGANVDDIKKKVMKSKIRTAVYAAVAKEKGKFADFVGKVLDTGDEVVRAKIKSAAEQFQSLPSPSAADLGKFVGEAAEGGKRRQGLVKPHVVIDESAKREFLKSLGFTDASEIDSICKNDRDFNHLGSESEVERLAYILTQLEDVDNHFVRKRMSRP